MIFIIVDTFYQLCNWDGSENRLLVLWVVFFILLTMGQCDSPLYEENVLDIMAKSYSQPGENQLEKIGFYLFEMIGKGYVKNFV